MGRRRYPPSPLVILERLERTLRAELEREAGELALMARFAAVRDPQGVVSVSFTRVQPHVAEGLSDSNRAVLAAAMREAADTLDPTTQEPQA